MNNYDFWSHENPIFLDFETQSACDLKEEGSRTYAQHKSTRILILSCAIDDVFHVWIPDYIKCPSPDAARLWPWRLKPRKEVRLYRGDAVPRVIIDSVKARPIVAHNAYGFDKLIWDRLIGTPVVGWIDSLYLARIEGRPGKLDQLAKSIVGESKDRASKLLSLLTTAQECGRGAWGDSDVVYPFIRPGDLAAFTTYAISDVELLIRMWPSFSDTPVEADVIAVNEAINNRGIAVDRELLAKVKELSTYSQSQAIAEIEHLTDGELHENNIRSTKQVHAWLAKFGVYIVNDMGKPVGDDNKLTLRRETVQKFIDSPYLIDDYMVAVKEIPPRVIEMLKLRMKALRITDAKIDRISDRGAYDGRIRDMQAYHAAHTGRWSSQIHNLPKTHPTIAKEVETYVTMMEQWDGKDTAKMYEKIKSTLPVESGRKAVTVDDVCSALVRPSLIAGWIEEKKTVRVKTRKKSTPRKQKCLTIADYSSVEGRCVPWMSDEEKLLEAYRNDVDVYKLFASKVFRKPVEDITKAERDGVGKIGILGLGYSMSAHKFRIYCASWGIDLVKEGVSAEAVVETYRNEYIKIAGFKPERNSTFRVQGLWQKLDKAVKEAVGERKETYAGKCVFEMFRSDLICTLPSGRRIYYPDCKIEDVIPPYCYTLNLPPTPKATVVYTGGRGKKSLYGGLITENISQAICRDLMASALVRLEEAGLNPVFHAHDETVDEVEEEKAEAALRKQVAIMSIVPDWAPGFPVACEGFVSRRFVKKAFKGSYEYTTGQMHKENGKSI